MHPVERGCVTFYTHNALLYSSVRQHNVCCRSAIFSPDFKRPSSIALPLELCLDSSPERDIKRTGPRCLGAAVLSGNLHHPGGRLRADRSSDPGQQAMAPP